MKTYYAAKNRNKRFKQDPDYFVYPPRNDGKSDRKPVGKIYRNRGEDGVYFLTILMFGQE
jgi:hypothetical protein